MHASATGLGFLTRGLHPTCRHTLSIGGGFDGTSMTSDSHTSRSSNWEPWLGGANFLLAWAVYGIGPRQEVPGMFWAAECRRENSLSDGQLFLVIQPAIENRATWLVNPSSSSSGSTSCCREEQVLGKLGNTSIFEELASSSHLLILLRGCRMRWSKKAL